MRVRSLVLWLLTALDLISKNSRDCNSNLCISPFSFDNRIVRALMSLFSKLSILLAHLTIVLATPIPACRRPT